jgi:hypothetical protein
MTIDDRLKLIALQALDRLEPATIDELVYEIQSRAVAEGVLPQSQAVKLERVYVGRDLIANWERTDPPLVQQTDYRPDELAPTGAPLRHAQSRFELTEAGEAEMQRLDRSAD